MHNGFSIAAVVVTFNRKELLNRNIQMLLSQDEFIDSIVIVDNHSTDGTEEDVISTFEHELTRIDYNYLPNNTGGAGGFEFGVRRAYDLGFDLIWLMDDDGRPMNESTLSKLTEKIESHNLSGKAFILNALVLCDSERLTFGFSNIFERKTAEVVAANNIIHNDNCALINPFNGTLLSKELVQEIGYPNGKFVIYGDEVDYAERALQAGAYIATVVDSEYYHPCNSEYKVIFGKRFHYFRKAKWRYYYSSRNSIILLKSQGKYAYILKKILRDTISIILTDNQKTRSLYYTLRGVFDGARGRLGAVVGPPSEVDKGR